MSCPSSLHGDAIFSQHFDDKEKGEVINHPVSKTFYQDKYECLNIKSVIDKYFLFDELSNISKMK